MTRTEFAHLFGEALEIAAKNAESQLGHSIARKYQIVFRADLKGRGVPLDEATDALYLGPDLFFRIIDLAVVRITPSATQVFVRASGHEPSNFEGTWNQPEGMGPFKQLIAERIEYDAT